MRNVMLYLLVLLVVNAFCEIGAQNGNLQQLSYGGDALPPYRPPTTSTTTTTEEPTTKSSFFGGIRNWFKKNPTTEAPESTTTTTTVRSMISTASARGSSNIPNQSTSTSIQPSSSTTGRRDYVSPSVAPSSPWNMPQSGPPSSPMTPTQSTSSNRRDYANPNFPPLSPSGSRPGSPTGYPQPQSSSSYPSTPTSSTSSGQRDYVNPNVATSKAPKIKEDFPALPPSRQSTSQPNTPTSGGASPSVWNSRPGSPTGSTVQSPWSTQPSSSGTPPGSNPTMVSFVPTTRPRGTRPGYQAPDTPSLATDNELTTLSENLLSKDVNNLNKYITLNLQGKTRSYDTTDEAPNALLQIDSKAFEITTVAKMKALFNNYELDTSVNEYVTPIEKKEEGEFVDAVLATSVMRQAMLFLQEKGIVTADPKTHRDLLKTIWFSLYSRGNGRIGSSGFEHIFLSEIKNGTVTGLHNALYFNDEEQKGRLDYKGYLKTLDFGNKGSIVKYRFAFNGISKPVNAMFVGISPELELALYTVCFEIRADKDCPVSLNGKRFNLPTYTFRYRGKRLVGSGFPEI